VAAARLQLQVGKFSGRTAAWVSDVQPEPYVRLLAAVGSRGLDVVVTTSHGASVVEHTLFAAAGNRFVPVLAFATGGSLIAQYQLDCATGPRRNELVSTQAWPLGPPGSPTSRFLRQFYRVSGARLRSIKVIRAMASGSAAGRLARRYRMGDEPLRSCTVAHR
jgi:hypothetical protein